MSLEYGIIGNCCSTALVSREGTIEWCCLPEFDSPSIFAKILDKEKGGEFSIITHKQYNITQRYIPKTNILETYFINETDSFIIYDFMPRYISRTGEYQTPPDVIRYIKIMKGTPEITFIYNPRLNYAHKETMHKIEGDYLKSFTGEDEYVSIYLYSNIQFDNLLQKQSITLYQDIFFLISYNQKLVAIDIERIELLFERTKVYWLNWVDRSNIPELYKEQVTRSALVLKLLTYQKTGAIIAAATTSIPETIGDIRNWDYRYCWIRDSSMTVSTLISIGHSNSARYYLQFILNQISHDARKIQIMYGIRGEKTLEEKTIQWLSGYKNSKPVRIGNNAYLQKQHDIFGILIDLIYQNFLYFKTSLADSEELWSVVRGLVRMVIQSWQKADHGIWEFRSSLRHFTFSKVLCWVAIDRAIKIAELLKKRLIAEPWNTIREEIKQDILAYGWNEKIGSFVQSYGSVELDAANLLIAFYGFLSPDDPMYVNTVYKTKEKLCKEGLMYRYTNKDDFGKPSSSFTVCTLWMIKSLYLIGHKEEAYTMLENLFSCANHLCLYSEDIDIATKELVGNFPQGYSHLALIDTVITLAGTKN